MRSGDLLSSRAVCEKIRENFTTKASKATTNRRNPGSNLPPLSLSFIKISRRLTDGGVHHIHARSDLGDILCSFMFVLTGT